MTGARTAGSERRFYAFALDRALGWGLVASTCLVAWRVWWSAGVLAEGVVLVVGIGVVVWLGQAVVAGGWGVSAGRALLGLRLLDARSGRPIGVGRAVLRSLVLAVATIPTLGLGVSSLAWTALRDPEGRRRGWHDQVAGSVVVDVREAPEVAEAEVLPEAPEVVNLTAMRLAPAAALPAAVTPVAAPTGAGPVPPPVVDQGDGAGSATRMPVSARRWRVAFDTGQSVVVEGLLLVGRDPEPRPGEQVRHLMALPSTDMSLSKTHAQLHLAEGTLVVMDRGSTNGSVLNRRGVARELRAGRPATLLEGDLVRLGDRELRVERQE